MRRLSTPSASRWPRAWASPRDQAGGLAWFRRAAAQGYPRAIYAVGYALANGEGVQRDDAEALRWYTRAWEACVPEGAFHVGTMHANGEGVAKDPAMARTWYCKAARAGHGPAADLLKHQGGVEACPADDAPARAAVAP